MAKRTSKYKKHLENIASMLPMETSDEVYDKIRLDGFLNQFLSCIRVCSSKKCTLDVLLNTLQDTFPGYINKNNMNKEIFLEMIRRHPDVASAWGYGFIGEEMRSDMIKQRAFEIASSTEDINVIKVYRELYENMNNINSTNENKGITFKLDVRGVE